MDIDTTAASKRLTDELFQGRDSMTFKEVKTSSMPIFIKSWFHFAVETWFAPEYKCRAAMGDFDFGGSAVRDSLEQSDRALKDTARFRPEVSRQIIDGALRHEVAYVEQPVEAVTGILFQTSEVIDGAYVVDFLQQFRREPYYADSIRTYVTEHEDSRLDQDLLEQFLINAERVAYETAPAQTFQIAVNAVTDMLNIIGASTSGQLSSDIWTTFIRSRQIENLYPGIAQALDALGQNIDRAMTADELVRSLDHSIESDAAANVSQTQRTPDSFEAVDHADLASESENLVIAEPTPDLPKGSDNFTDSAPPPIVPFEDDSPDDINADDVTFEGMADNPLNNGESELDLIVEDGHSVDPTDGASDEESIEPDFLTGADVEEIEIGSDTHLIEPASDPLMDDTTSLSDASTFAPPEDQFGLPPSNVVAVERREEPGEAENDSETTSTESEPSVETELERLEKVAIANTPTSPSDMNLQIPPVEISEKLEKMFVKKLFEKKPEDYQTVLTQLEDAVSWEEAFSIIEEIWQERALNLFSKESQEFTRVFYERYYPPT